MATVCFCNMVTEEEIEEFLKKYPNATFQEVRNGTAASLSCGRCALSLKKVIERLKPVIPPNDQLTLNF